MKIQFSDFTYLPIFANKLSSDKRINPNLFPFLIHLLRRLIHSKDQLEIIKIGLWYIFLGLLYSISSKSTKSPINFFSQSLSNSLCLLPSHITLRLIWVIFLKEFNLIITINHLNYYYKVKIFKNE